MTPEQRERELVEWFRSLFSSRTPAKSVLDADPRYRVYWTEILNKMRELEYTDGAVDLRYEWDRIFDVFKLRSFCNHCMKEAGESLRLPRK